MKMDMRCESLSIHKSNEKYSSGLRSEVYGLISLREAYEKVRLDACPGVLAEMKKTMQK